MSEDDFLGIDGLTNGSRKIPFSGIMDSLDSRFATANKTPRGAIAELKQIVDSHGNVISSIKNMISDEYDDSADYDVGDYCIHDNVRYCCNTEISGGETWNSAHWDVEKVDDDITEINSALSGFTGMKTLRATTPTTINTNVKIIDDSTLYGNWLTIGYMILYNNTYFMWLSDTSVKSLRIQADGLYINMGVNIGECPIWIIFSKMPS